jgi:hypothetical protein
MKLGHRYTIEEQLSNTANGGIQVDVFPSLEEVVVCEYHGYQLSLDKSPKDLNINRGETISMTSKFVFPGLFLCDIATAKLLRHLSKPDTLRDIVRFITPNPVFNVSYREVSPPPGIRMEIIVLTLTGRKYILDAGSLSTVKSTKKKINATAGIPFSVQQLRYSGQTLENHKLLSGN